VVAESSAAVQIEALFDALPARQQATFKEALRIACEQWKRSAHGLGTLAELVRLAGLTRSYDAVGELRRHLASGLLLDPGLERGLEFRGILFSVLLAACPNPRACGLVELADSLPALDPRHGGQVFLALAKSCPERFPEFVPRLRYRHGQGMPMPVHAVMSRLVDYVSLPTIGRRLRELRRPDLNFVLDGLAKHERAPCEVHMVGNHQWRLARRNHPPEFEVPIDARHTDASFQHALYGAAEARTPSNVIRFEEVWARKLEELAVDPSPEMAREARTGLRYMSIAGHA
jgi:hypothetical protein